jgi:hypothetical protein
MPKEHTAMDLLKCTLAPAEYNTLPPSVCTQTTFSKRVDASANFLVNDAALNPVYENVPTSSGAIVWMPGKGPYACYRMGIVPKGTQSMGLTSGNPSEVFKTSAYPPTPASVSVPPGSVGPYDQTDVTDFGLQTAISTATLATTTSIIGGVNYTWWTGSTIAAPKQFTLRFNSNLPLPYNAKVTTDVITFTPPPTTNTLSQCRIYAGSLRVISDTAPIGATSLSGYLTAAAISDITDVVGGQNLTSQNATGAVAFDATYLTQCAVSTKDVLKEVGVNRGVVCLVGPDIAPVLTTPDTYTLGRQVGSMMPPVQMNNQTPTGVVLTAGHYPGLNYMAWVSPYAITDITNYTNPNIWSGSLAQNIFVNTGNGASMNPIGGALEITINCQINPTGAEVTPGVSYQTGVTFIHVYASVSSDGSIWYDNVNEGYMLAAGTADTPKQVTWTATGHAKQYMTGGFANTTGALPPTQNADAGVSCGGMYIGTSVMIVTTNTGDNGTAGLAVGEPLLEAGWMTFRLVDDYAPGELGPVRVVRYDSLANQMICRVDGVFYAEAVPGALTAAYVQAAGNMSRSCANFNALNFLSFCYNQDDTPFRRIWDSYEWRDMVKGLLPQLSSEFLRSFGSDRLLDAAKAAGIMVEENDGKRRKTDGRAVSVYPSSLSPQEFGPPQMDTAARLKNLDDIMTKVKQETERATVYKPPPNY